MVRENLELTATTDDLRPVRSYDMALHGAVLQAAVYALLLYRNIVTTLSVVFFFGHKLAYTTCVLTGLLPNPQMKETISHHKALIFPDKKGAQGKAVDTTVCAIVLGVVFDHPLGMLDRASKGLGIVLIRWLNECRKTL